MDVAPFFVAAILARGVGVGHFVDDSVLGGGGVGMGVGVVEVMGVGYGGCGVGEQQALVGEEEGVLVCELAFDGGVVLEVGVRLAVDAVFVYAETFKICSV